MHVVYWTAGGLLLLAAFVAIGALVGAKRGATPAIVGGLFTAVWLIAAIYNGYNGWANHGIPLVNEIAAFLPIFGIPAAAAWLWSKRSRFNR